MRPAFLEAKIDQRGAVGEVVVATRNVARTLFAILIGDDDEMPVLLVTG